VIYAYEQLSQQSRPSWSEYLEQLPEDKRIKSDATFDIWSFGMILFILSAPDGASVFHTTAQDNIIRSDELRLLAFEWEERKLTEVSKLVWPLAQDLVLWCLQTRPSRRPQSFDDILKHPFLGGQGSVRYLGSNVVPEEIFRSPWDCAEEMHYGTLNEATERRALQLHDAIEHNKLDTVKEMFELGDVHYNLPLQTRGMSTAQRSIRPLHRAARYGHFELMGFLLKEIDPESATRVGTVDQTEPEPEPESDQNPEHEPEHEHESAMVLFSVVGPEHGMHVALDACTDYQYTPLHWSAVFGHANIALELITHGCNTALETTRGKTAWDLAESEHQSAVLKVLEDCAAQKDDHGKLIFPALSDEQKRRARRPDVTDHFRDDIEIDSDRMDFWSVRPWDHWRHFGTGTFGQVFEVFQVSPAIEVFGRHFRRMAVKVPKASGVDALRSEVTSLHTLDHENVVAILGMFFSTSPGSYQPTWAMALEFCETNLQEVLYGKKDWRHVASMTARGHGLGTARRMGTATARRRGTGSARSSTAGTAGHNQYESIEDSPNASPSTNEPPADTATTLLAPGQRGTDEHDDEVEDAQEQYRLDVMAEWAEQIAKGTPILSPSLSADSSKLIPCLVHRSGVHSRS